MAASESEWTVLRVLDWTRGFFSARSFDSPRLDAEVLLAHVLGLERVMLYARHDQPLNDNERSQLRGLVQRRAAGEPVAHLTGTREFWSLPFAINRDVLVPRPDTETLVAHTLDRLPSAAAQVVDVGTGSGCIAAALAHERKQLRVLAVDVSDATLAVAQKNFVSLSLDTRVSCQKSNLLTNVSLPTKADAIVANLPYIPCQEIQGLAKEVRHFETQVSIGRGRRRSRAYP